MADSNWADWNLGSGLYLMVFHFYPCFVSPVSVYTFTAALCFWRFICLCPCSLYCSQPWGRCVSVWRCAADGWSEESYRRSVSLWCEIWDRWFLDPDLLSLGLGEVTNSWGLLFLIKNRQKYFWQQLWHYQEINARYVSGCEFYCVAEALLTWCSPGYLRLSSSFLSAVLT